MADMTLISSTTNRVIAWLTPQLDASLPSGCKKLLVATTQDRKGIGRAFGQRLGSLSIRR
jgi:hypothetical protein